MKKSPDTTASVDAYVAALPEAMREKFETFRLLMKKIAPKATERISYGMPGWDENGVLVWFAAWKEHYGFYPSSEPIVVFKDKLKKYKTSKGCIQFPADDALPVKLITDIVRYRQKTIAEKLKKKK